MSKSTDVAPEKPSEKEMLREMANDDSLEMRAAYEALYRRKYDEEP